MMISSILNQGVTKRCRLSWLTNIALVYEPIHTAGIVIGMNFSLLCTIFSDGLKCRLYLALNSMMGVCKSLLLRLLKNQNFTKFNSRNRYNKNLVQTCGLLLLEPLEYSSLFACSGVAPNLKQIPMGLILPPAASQRRVS
jgi:hypothetical protein